VPGAHLPFGTSQLRGAWGCLEASQSLRASGRSTGQQLIEVVSEASRKREECLYLLLLKSRIRILDALVVVVIIVCLDYLLFG
jgi:hypothetical protein